MATKALAAKKKITVVIADDQTLFREGIKDLLENEKAIEVIGEAADGQEALRMVKKLKPDVILLDIKLPHMDGIEATRQIHKDCPGTNVLILSSYEDESHVMEAIQAGASGFVLKHAAPQELVTAIHEAMQGRLYLTPALTREVLASLSLASASGPIVQLTPRQLEVLRHIAEGRRMKEIAALLGLSTRTVETYKYEMMQTLGVQSTAELVRYALEHRVVTLHE